MSIFKKNRAKWLMSFFGMLTAVFCALVLAGCDGGDDDGNPTFGTLTYGGQTYGTVKIGKQTWMAENLNYETADSWCYSNNTANCNTYGRLYTWDAAMSACPSGWHLPSRSEWNNLVSAAGSSTAGKKLKSQTGWNSGGNGTDAYGFSALPGGSGVAGVDGGSYGYAGERGRWWSSTADGSDNAYYRGMDSGFDNAVENTADKNGGFSVRCLMD